MFLLDGAIRHYAWGSHDALATVRGETSPTDHPEAEMWFGAHPGDPSSLNGETNGKTLLDVISASPDEELGSRIAASFTQQLPFLMKLLAADSPLSLQAHPSLSQAQQGFLRENKAGIPLDAAVRNYHDPNHKPELIVAITPFHALAGFRDPRATIDLFTTLDVPELDPYIDFLRTEPDSTGIRALMTTFITLPEPQLELCIRATHQATERLVARGGPWTTEAVTFLDLVSEYSIDAGTLCALLLNRITLQPGEAIFMGPGMLHAYLHGLGVEIMANSDNVLRGGLTPKHMDVPELMRVVNFEPLLEPCLPAAPVISPDEGLMTGPGITSRYYPTPVPEFRLSTATLDPGVEVPVSVEGPLIMLVTEGSVTLSQNNARDTLFVPAGHAAWISATETRPHLHTGSTPATVFLARIP